MGLYVHGIIDIKFKLKFLVMELAKTSVSIATKTLHVLSLLPNYLS